MVLLGQCTSPYGHQLEGHDGSKKDPAAGPPALFTGIGTGRLLPVQESAELAGFSLHQDSLKKELRSVTRSIAAEDYVAAFWLV
jgi:hypothetical protein